MDLTNKTPKELNEMYDQVKKTLELPQLHQDQRQDLEKALTEIGNELKSRKRDTDLPVSVDAGNIEDWL